MVSLMQTSLFWCPLHADATPSLASSYLNCSCWRMWEVCSWPIRRKLENRSYRPHHLLGFEHSSVNCVPFAACTQQGSRSLWVCFVAEMVTRTLLSQSLSLFLVDSWRSSYLLWKPADKGRQSNLCPQHGRTIVWPASLKDPNSASWSLIQTVLMQNSYTCRRSVPHLITRQWFKLFEILKAVWEATFDQNKNPGWFWRKA